MSVGALRPLVTPTADAWLSPYVRAGRGWWLLEEDTEEGLGNSLAELVADHGVEAGTRWVALVEGPPDRLSYITSAAGMPTGRRVPGSPARVVLGPLSAADAVTVLDRAETAPVTVLLLSVDDAEVAATVQALGRPGVASTADGVVAVVLRHPGERWAAVGLLGEQPARASAGSAPRTSDVPPEAALPPTPGPAPAATRGRIAPLVAAAAAVVLIVAGSWVVLGGHSPTGSAPPRGVVTGVTAAPTAPTVPGPSNQPAVEEDPGHGDVLLFGGLQPVGTWLLTNGHWKAARPRAAPSDRFGSAMAYDPALGRVLLFGGREKAGAVVNDTWAWDGPTWAELDSAAPRPPGWEFSGMAWDQARGQLVLLTPPNIGYAGGASVTWTWGAHGWDRRLPTTAPPAEPNTAMVYDPATRSVLLVLSGLSPGASPSTWSWDGVTWHQLHPPHQPDLGGFTSFLAQVPGAAQLILTRVSVDPPQGLETWTWDGQDWTRQHPSVTPTGVVGLVVDGPGSGAHVIALGRASRTLPLDLAWAWTGSNWAPQHTAN